MRNATCQACFAAILTWSAAWFLPPATSAQTVTEKPIATAMRNSLKVFLQNQFGGASQGGDNTRYFAALVNLSTDTTTQQAIVYLTGDGWCGSGGCNTLVLARSENSWRVVAKITITRPPIRVLDETSYGWRSIGVRVQGGGIQPGYEAELRFDGKTYPSNPSMPPARPLQQKAAGETVISASETGVPLYP